jgi:amino acid adenylation domain-containing protein
MSENFSSKLLLEAGQKIKEREYWLDKFAGNPPGCYFPYDNKKAIHQPGRENKEFSRVDFTLTGESFHRLMDLGNQADLRVYIILTAVLVLLLNKYSGSNDIVVGAPVYSSNPEAVEHNGELINTVLALRTQLKDDMTFKALVLQMGQTIYEATTHQNYPIELVLEHWRGSNRGGRDNNNRLLDVAVLLGNIHDRNHIDPVNPSIVFSFIREKDALKGELDFLPLFYKKTTAAKLADHFKQLLQNALKEVDLPISSIDMLTGAEKTQLLVDFNDTHAEYPVEKTIHQLFEEQAAKTPDNIAVIDSTTGGSTVYRELNKKSNQLAQVLREHGVQAESVVGIMIERSIDTIVGMLAILKAGGAYLPIDPWLPQERVLYMLENSGGRVLLSHRQALKGISFTALRDFESRKDIEVVVTPTRSHIKGFNQLPLPDRSLINLQNYKNKIGMASTTNCISLQATRGCPYQCLYCHKIWSKHHVYRSAENIYTEIEYYYKNGVVNFAFIDDCFNLNMDISGELFRMIIKNKLDLQLFFPNGLRGDTMTRDYIDLMVEAGTRGINLSLETASPRLQKLLKKNLDLDKFKDVITYIAAQHPHVILELASMHGFPSETEEEAMMTLNFIKDIKWLHFPYIHILKIFPNTEMEAFALAQGISKEDIMASRDRAFHELPETLPFPKSFTRKYQANFLNEYFLNKERLEKVMPAQMKIMNEKALVQKYNAYLPTEIKGIADIINFAQLGDIDIPAGYTGGKEDKYSVFDWKPTARETKPGTRKMLFLDLSQHFSSHSMLYNVAEQPLGLMYLLTYLKQRFPDGIDGRIYKSGNDFDNFEALKVLVDEYQPDLVGIRTLTFFKGFFHETVSLLRQWGVKAPIIAGGPYASSDYDTLLKDSNIDLVCLGEGEETLEELIEKMMENDFKIPDTDVLQGIKGIAFVKNDRSKDKARAVILPDQFTSLLGKKDRGNPGPLSAGNNLAYVMYTSGSTGRPKGVMVEHRQVNNCLQWMQDTFKLGPADRVIQRTNLSFDPSVWEIFWPLMTGAAVKVIGEQQGKDPEFLIRLMSEDSDITVMYCPATLVAAMTYLLEVKAVKSKLKLPWLIIGAEPIAMETVKVFYTYFSGQIVNTYGPTECTINNTYYKLTPHDERLVVPIGKPVANNRIYILSPDSRHRLLPVRMAGEICIAGASVSRGYINNRLKTGENFINNPYGEGKLYKTGDIGRWLEDGTIEIMGRIDDQLKIRGYRIEPGEIERTLLSHEFINECVVAARDSKNKELKQHSGECKKCGIWFNYPGIAINEDGICNICENLDRYKKLINRYFGNMTQLEKKIREGNKNKKSKYDCLLVYACERVATYALYKLVEMGFNVLTATYDSGHYDPSSLERIKAIAAKIGVDHIFLKHQKSDEILKESLNVAQTMCKGCIHTSSALSGEYAYKNNIKFVIGETLSRGQIVENKLYKFMEMGIDDLEELEREIAKLQRNTALIDKKIFDIIDIKIVTDGSLYDKVEFIDFYRYCDVTNEEMIRYLDLKDPYWKNLDTASTYSTDCKICQVGNFHHLKEKGYHYTGSAKSWDQRLGLTTLEYLQEDLIIGLDAQEHREFLDNLGYRREISVEADDKRLYAYFTSDDAPSAAELREYLSYELPDYMIPSYFIQMDEIPLTTNGKVDRRALPDAEPKFAGDYIGPENELEEKLVKIWSEVLNIQSGIISIHSNFFDLGGHSLSATILVAKILKELNIKMSLVEMFEKPTVRQLAEFLKETAGEKYSPIEPVEVKEYYELSPAQKRLFILDEIGNAGIVYNLPSAWIISGPIDIQRLKITFDALISRHESLRTSFEMIDGEPIQKVHDQVDLEIEYFDMKEVKEEQKTEDRPDTHLSSDFIRPFDLSRAPLLRVGILKEGEEKHIMMLDIHHIITDGFSLRIFMKDFTSLYTGTPLPPLQIQYKDFSQWQNCEENKEYQEKQEAYWLEKFKDGVPTVNFPTDYTRPRVQSFAGDSLHFALDHTLTAKLKDLAKKTETTLNMVLLAVYNILLSKYSSQEEVVVGIGIAGRTHPRLENIIGFFVNTLVIQSQPRGDKTFSRFLEEVKKDTLAAYENQEYPFDEMVDKLNISRDLGRNPMVDVLFMQDIIDFQEFPLDGLKFTAHRFSNKVSHLDQVLFFKTGDNDLLEMILEYSTVLFKPSTAENIAQRYIEILSQVAANKEIELKDIEISLKLKDAALNKQHEDYGDFDF